SAVRCAGPPPRWPPDRGWEGRSAPAGTTRGWKSAWVRLFVEFRPSCLYAWPVMRKPGKDTLMAGRDTSLIEPSDIASALSLLTRIPAPGGPRGAEAAWAWPVAGLIVALIAALAGWLGLALGLVPGVAAALVLGLQMMLTGALHEDGLSDSADG